MHDCCIVDERSIAVLRRYDDRRGLAERRIRCRLERRGWLVWRGGYLHAPNVETYPNVTRKYERLLSYLPQHYVNVLQYLCVVHRGMPDLLCYKAGTLKFIECKLDYEPLRDAQKQCIVKLQALGFPVEVWRVAQANVRYRRRRLDVLTDVHERLESQEPLTPHL